MKHASRNPIVLEQTTMSHISHVLISGRPVSMHDAEKYIFHHACMTGYDPSEVNAIWSRLTEGDRDDACDAAAELEAIDLDSAIEFILDDEELS